MVWRLSLRSLRSEFRISVYSAFLLAKLAKLVWKQKNTHRIMFPHFNLYGAKIDKFEAVRYSTTIDRMTRTAIQKIS